MTGKHPIPTMILAIVSVLILSACGGPTGAGGKTTCSEWLAVAPTVEDILYARQSKEANNIIDKMLKDHGYSGSQGLNRAIAKSDVDLFCGYPGSPKTQNSNRQIQEAIDWP